MYLFIRQFDCTFTGIFFIGLWPAILAADKRKPQNSENKDWGSTFSPQQRLILWLINVRDRRGRALGQSCDLRVSQALGEIREVLFSLSCPIYVLFVHFKDTFCYHPTVPLIISIIIMMIKINNSIYIPIVQRSFKRITSHYNQELPLIHTIIWVIHRKGHTCDNWDIRQRQP